MIPARGRFYWRWIVANGWSELLGLGGTFVLGFAGAALLIEETSALDTIVAAVAAVVLGTLLEGVVVGYAQGRVLHTRVPELPPGQWVVATAAGAAAAWTLGMIPSTVITLLDANSPSDPPPDLEGLWQYSLAAGLGAILGGFLGIPQAWVLRRYVSRPRRWVLANVVAWAVGMPLVFKGMDWVGAEADFLRFAGGVAVTCLSTGVVVGAIHGRWLVALLPAMRVPKMTARNVRA